MLIFFSTVHVLLCVFMIFVILLQPGKDAGMGAALGGGAASSAFGGRGAVTFLGKVTAFCAIAFFATSLGLSFVGLRPSVADSVTVTGPTPLPTGAPAPGPSPAPAAQEAAPAPAAQEAAPVPAPDAPAEKAPSKP